MKQLSATEAARSFSDVLDSVEARRESFVVVRHGRPVAMIGPPVGGAGRALKDVLRAHRPDGDWADEVRGLREGVGSAGGSPWRD